MTETHCTPYTAHPGTTKMYQDLRSNFWWERMNDDSQIRAEMFNMPTSQSGTQETSGTSYAIAGSRMEVESYYHEFCHRTS